MFAEYLKNARHVEVHNLGAVLQSKLMKSSNSDYGMPTGSHLRVPRISDNGLQSRVEVL